LGGVALILGALCGIVTMSLHPTSRDLAAGESFHSVANLAIGVHALAIASAPLSFLGALALTQRLQGADRMALSALVAYGFGLVAVMIAAAVSGFVAPNLLQEQMSSAPSASDALRIALDYNHHLNQAFAKIFTVASSTAILLWSIAIVRDRALPAGIGFYGLFIGPATIVALASGHLRLDVHGMGAVVFAQALWLVLSGISMIRANAPGAVRA
jgi:hypothetical protein